jgi:Lectin C-type domain
LTIFFSDAYTLTGGGTSDNCANNVTDTKIQMSTTSDWDTFGQIGFVSSKKAALNLLPFQKDDPTDPANYLCEKITEYTCNTGSFLFDGLCYTLFPTPVNHAQADYNCQLLGGQILTIKSRKQQTFINAAFPANVAGYTQIWLDYRKITYSTSDASYRALDDTTFVFDSSGIDFTNVTPDLTDPSKNCVAMDVTQGDFNGWKTLSCFENASYICQQPQLISPALVRIIPDIQLLLPLDLYSGFMDLTMALRGNTGNMVAISTDSYLPSGLVGAAHFLGISDSYVLIDNVGILKNIRYQFGISISMWVYIDMIYDGETQVVIDARPECNTGSEIDEGFTLSLVNQLAQNIATITTNPTCAMLAQSAGTSTTTAQQQNISMVAKLCNYNVTTKCTNFISPTVFKIPVNQWIQIGFSYNAVSKRGSFFIGQNYGYYDKTSGSDVINGYFTFDSGNWLTNSSSVAVNAPIQIGSSKYDQKAFSGKISCLQWYEGPLTHPQFLYLKDCPVNVTYQGKSSLCPQGYDYYKKNCYKISLKAQDFATAEAYCTSTPGRKKVIKIYHLF